MDIDTKTWTRVRSHSHHHALSLSIGFAMLFTVGGLVHAESPLTNDEDAATLIASATGNNLAGAYGTALDEAEQALALTHEPSLRMQALNEKGLALLRSVQESWDTLPEPDVARRALSDAEDAFLLALHAAPAEATIDGLALNLAGVLLAQRLLDDDPRRQIHVRALLESLSDRLPDGDDRAWVRSQLESLPEDASRSLFDALPTDVGEPVYDATDRSIGRFTLPERLHFENPQYTESARKNRIQGVVAMRAIVGSSGHILAIEVVEGQPDGLTEAAVAAFRRARFRPATLDGKPVAVYYTATANFRLQ